MLLVIDAGNTNIKLGIFDGDELVFSWRMSVKVMRTAGISVYQLHYRTRVYALYEYQAYDGWGWRKDRS